MRCPHRDERQAKYEIDGELHVLCVRCREGWGKHSAAVLNLPPPPVDNAALGEAVYDLMMLRDELMWTEDQESRLRQTLREDLLWTKRTFKLTWAELGAMCGMTRQAVHNYTQWARGEYLFGDPKDLKNQLNRKRAIKAAQMRRYRARVKERRASQPTEV
jgi:hypothetical protein